MASNSNAALVVVVVVCLFVYLESKNKQANLPNYMISTKGFLKALNSHCPYTGPRPWQGLLLVPSCNRVVRIVEKQ